MTTIAKLDKRTSHSWFDHKRYRFRMALIMFSADLLGFGAAAGLLLLLNLWLHLFVFQWSDLFYLTIVFICLIFYIQTKLYPGLGLNPAEEIRLVTLNTFIGFLLSAFVLGFRQMPWHPNQLALIPFSILSIACVLTMRWGARILSVYAKVWGAPVAVIGSGRDANQLAHYFLDRLRLGFIPRYVITDIGGNQEVTVPVANFSRSDLLSCPEDYFSSQQIYTALLDISHASDLMSPPMFSRLSLLFPRLIFVSTGGMSGTSLRVHDFEGIIGVEVKRNILNPLSIFVKKGMDIFFSLLLLVLSLPLWVLTILLIWFDSPGPIFYTQLRVGRSQHSPEGKEHLTGHVNMINIYKFRTMVIDAEQKLEGYLNANPHVYEEWQRTQKLRVDPRITRVGKWLRKFSIDELPQILNVLKGEMSLVGPRPLPLYHHGLLSSDAALLRNSLKPGITGLWQISGRSNTGIPEMEALDAYYVHNWSIWLDIYILLRTVWVVLSKDGAY